MAKDEAGAWQVTDKQESFQGGSERLRVALQAFVDFHFVDRDGESCRYCGSKLNANYVLQHTDTCIFANAREALAQRQSPASVESFQGMLERWDEYIRAKQANGEFAESTKRHLAEARPIFTRLVELRDECKRAANEFVTWGDSEAETAYLRVVVRLTELIEGRSKCTATK